MTPVARSLLLALPLLAACTADTAPGEPGPQGERGPRGETGPQGPEGPAGRPGELRVYGNGSAGELIARAGEPLVDLHDGDGNLQFASITIPDGVAVEIESGATLRVTGDVVIDGTLIVKPAYGGGNASNGHAPANGMTQGGARPAERTLGETPALGGKPGIPIATPALVTRIGPAGGAGAYLGAAGNLYQAGGSIAIVAGGTITVRGRIEAQGRSFPTYIGSGGGGGGVVLLASRTSIHVDQTAGIDVRGGDGGESGGQYYGPGGGGGGGLIRLIAPTLDVSLGAQLDVAGGAAGARQRYASTPNVKYGGQAGGSSAGWGGAGGRVTGNLTPDAAEAGGDGKVILTEADPTALLL